MARNRQLTLAKLDRKSKQQNHSNKLSPDLMCIRLIDLELSELTWDTSAEHTDDRTTPPINECTGLFTDQRKWHIKN